MQSTSMEPATGVIAAMKSAIVVAATVEAWRRMITAPDITVHRRPVCITGAIAMAGPRAVPGMAVKAAAVVTVIPGTGTNEYTINEPIGPVIPVWRARVWIVAIITVGANRRCANAGNHRAYTDANGNLSASTSRNSEEQHR